MSLFDTRPKVSVLVEQTGERYACASTESLLQGMLRLGRKGIPVGCVNGGCGGCKVRVLEGRTTPLGPVRGGWCVCRVRVREAGPPPLGPFSRAPVSEADEQQGFPLACRVAPATS